VDILNIYQKIFSEMVRVINALGYVTRMARIARMQPNPPYNGCPRLAAPQNAKSEHGYSGSPKLANPGYTLPIHDDAGYLI